jgi:hypothetical protein
VDGLVHLRPIGADARVADSVALRVQYALTYTPGNLTIRDGQLADTYSMVSVMQEGAAVAMGRA